MISFKMTMRKIWRTFLIIVPLPKIVDVVCSTTLLMAMSADRYQHKKEEAWKWEEPLTPYGIKLRDELSRTSTSTTDIIGSPLKRLP